MRESIFKGLLLNEYNYIIFFIITLVIIGITGPLCTGKSVLSEMLIERGFVRLSFAEMLRKEMNEKRIEINRAALQDYGNKMREERGADFFAKKIIAILEEGRNYVIEGFRNPGEIDAFRKFRDFVLIGLTAPDELRMQWMLERRKDNDPDDLNALMAIDARDRGIGEPYYGQQSALCYQMADAYIINNTSFEDLKLKIERVLEDLGCS